MDAKPTRLLSKPIIDPVNTFVWFAMDALWLGQLKWAAYTAAALTVLTGLVLLVLGWRKGRGEIFADLGMNCWIAMNVVWMLHDLNDEVTPRWFAAVAGGLGAVLILAAARHSQDIRRVRILRR